MCNYFFLLGEQREDQSNCSHYSGMDGTAQCKSESFCLSGALKQRRYRLISQLVHKRLGAQMLGLLVEVEQERTEKRLPHILPLLLASLTISEGEQDTGRLYEEPPPEVIFIGRKGQSKDLLKGAV